MLANIELCLIIATIAVVILASAKILKFVARALVRELIIETNAKKRKKARRVR